MTKIIFYHGPRSLKAEILKVVLFEKQCDFEDRKVNTYKLADLKPLKGKHVLIDNEILYQRGEVVLSEFPAILADIEETCPTPRLMPLETQDLAVQEKWLDYIDNLPMVELLYDQTGVLIRNGLIKAYEGRLQKLDQACKNRQQFEESYKQSVSYGKRMLSVLNDKYDDYVVSQKLFEFLNNMEAALLGKNYLTGSEPLLADFVIAVSLHSLKEAGLSGMWQGGKFPRVSMFYSRFLHRESFYKVCLERGSIREDLFLASLGAVHCINKRLHEPV